MRVGVCREAYPGERRVALVPAVLPALTKAGLEVVIEAKAGEAAEFSDGQYSERGARIAESRADVFALADVILAVRGPGADGGEGRGDFDPARKGQTIIGFMHPFSSAELMRDLAARGVTAFAMELIPRITRAQAMDALSSMSTVAGYRAVLEAAAALPRMFPLLMTAAGTVAPARVFVIGAGVAGLQAIATARRLGAIVQGYDIRPAAREEIESLGAKSVQIELDEDNVQDTGGYARQMDEAFYCKQRELLKRTVAGNDVVITTAIVPGRKAPVLVTSDMVAGMRPGSVIVDLAAEQGGNCELTQPGRTVTANGATIVGTKNLASAVPTHASQMYARNISSFLLHLVKDGELRIDLEDEITRETLVMRDGEVVNPRVREALELDRSGGSVGSD